MLSIFATPAEAKAFGKLHGVGTPRRPLKPKTLARIAGGLDKFVIKAAKPFIVRIAHGDHCDGTSRWGNTAHDVDQPLGTVAGSKDFAIVDATLAPFSVPNLGERAGQAPRCGSIDRPLPTVTGTASGARLVAAHLVRDHGQSIGAACDQPAPTITGVNHTALVAALVTKHYTGVTGSSMSEPLDTVTSTDHNAVTCAHLLKMKGDSIGTAADEPMPTITSGAGAARNAGAAHSLGVSAVYLSHLYGTNKGGNGEPASPAPTVTGSSNHTAVAAAHAVPYLIGAGGSVYAAKPKSAGEPANTVMVNDRRAIVAAFISTYYGNSKSGHAVTEPMPTVVSKDRIQLVTVTIDGTTYVVTDIAMRMLTPRELARAQGFPADYIIDRTADGRPVSKADQVKLIGNSVCCQVAKAIARENVVNLGVLDAPLIGGAA